MSLFSLCSSKHFVRTTTNKTDSTRIALGQADERSFTSYDIQGNMRAISSPTSSCLDVSGLARRQSVRRHSESKLLRRTLLVAG